MDHQQLARACAGCLGSAECWICTGHGCHRCAATGRCHVCTTPVRVLDLVPAQPRAAAARSGRLATS